MLNLLICNYDMNVKRLNYREGMCCFFTELLMYVSILLLASSSRSCSFQEVYAMNGR